MATGVAASVGGPTLPRENYLICWAVVVAQLVQRLHPIPEVRGSNPVIGKIRLVQTSTASISGEIFLNRIGARVEQRIIQIQA